LLVKDEIITITTNDQTEIRWERERERERKKQLTIEIDYLKKQIEFQ